MSKITIIVPVYDVEKYINRCVDSILNQTFTDFECILVDDGSPDNCGKICDEYAKKDKRIKVIHKPNGGLSDARNAGIDIAMGEYLSFIDSDDWIHPQMLEILYEGIKKSNVLLSVCAYEEIKNERETYFKKIEKPIFEIKNGMSFLTENNVTAVVAWNKLYHRELFNDIRYPLGKWHEDEFTTYKLLYKAVNIAVCDIKLYMYFFNQKGISKGGWTVKRLDALEAFEDMICFFEEKGEDKYLIRSVYVFLRVANEQYDKCIITENYKDIRKRISQRMRKVLKRYSKFLKINFISHSSYYCIAYPYFSYIIILLLKMRAAIKRIVRKVA